MRADRSTIFLLFLLTLTRNEVVSDSETLPPGSYSSSVPGHGDGGGCCQRKTMASGKVFTFTRKGSEEELKASYDCKDGCIYRMEGDLPEKEFCFKSSIRDFVSECEANSTISASCECGLAQRSSRIVGGVETEVNEYPWQARLLTQLQTGQQLCGGSLVSSQWVLTAAHCTQGEAGNPDNIAVYLGEHDQSTTVPTSVQFGVSQVINHPNYQLVGEMRIPVYDFSLLKLASPVDFAALPAIRPICLPSDTSLDYAGLTATVTGFGATSYGGVGSDTLLEAEVVVLSNADCLSDNYNYSAALAAVVEAGYGELLEQSLEQMMCAAFPGKDACQGDSGGPLVTAGSGDGVTSGQNYELIGVVSTGIGCADPSYPGVYARVTKQLEWINQYITSPGITCRRRED